MNKDNVFGLYEAAKRRFHNELSKIQEEYISSNFTFKVGDIVKYKDLFKSGYMLIDAIFFDNKGDYSDKNSYKNPRVVLSGRAVDETGKLKTYFSDSDQHIGVIVYADERTKIEMTNIHLSK